MNIFRVPVAIERPLTETERGVSDARCAEIVHAAISEALADYAERLGRGMTDVEAAAVEETAYVIARREAWFEVWQARQKQYS